MIISNWNICGWTCDKSDYVSMLTRQSTVLCLTEVWHPPEKRPNGLFTLAPPNEGRFRRGGGVALLVPDGITLKHLCSISHSKYQLLSASCFGLIIVAAYISPTITPSQFQECLETIRRMSQGTAIVVGDFNSRHTSWDTANNRYGLRFAKWAAKCNFTIAAPSIPTCYSSRGGSSTVDLLLCRGPTASKPEIENTPCRSDHKPVHTSISLSSPGNVDDIPLSLLGNIPVQQRVSREYENTVPPIIEALDHASSWQQLEVASKQLAHRIVQPWARFRKPRPARFRPGWTHSLDKMAKMRTALLKSSAADDRAKAKELDKRIKRGVRRNRKRLLDDVCASLEGAPPGRDSTIISRVLSITRDKPSTVSSLCPDSFQTFMKSLQNETSTRINPVHFQVPSTFSKDCEQEITTSKKKKAPGPCKIRAEMLQLRPDIFGKAIGALWAAVGRIAYMPSVLRSGTYAPIFKSGDPSLPTNYRPISLTSILRRIITSSLVAAVAESASPHLNQWGFQKQSNSECALAYVVNNQQQNLPYTAVLDLKKAYDTVPRDLLLKLVKKRLPSTLASMVQCLLVPSVMRTKGQKSQTHFLTLSGVPQGDPPSPALFNIFMDEFLWQSNTGPLALTSCVADDVTVLAKTPSALQNQLNIATAWANSSGMSWSVQKSFQLESQHSTTLTGLPLPQAKEVSLLGTTLGPYGITHTKLLHRISDAMKRMSALSRLLRRWKLSYKQKRAIVKTFIFSVTDYVLYLQPITGALRQAAHGLDRMAAGFVLGTRIPQKQTSRALALAGLLPLEHRRLAHMAKCVQKFSGLASSPTSTATTRRKAAIIMAYTTIKSFLDENNTPLVNEDPGEWYKETLQSLSEKLITDANRHQRKLPLKKVGCLPPVLCGSMAPSTMHKAVLWYFNTLEMRAQWKRDLNDKIKTLLEKEKLTPTDENNLEDIFFKFNLT